MMKVVEVLYCHYVFRYCCQYLSILKDQQPTPAPVYCPQKIIEPLDRALGSWGYWIYINYTLPLII
jgi:hypothetical protein